MMKIIFIFCFGFITVFAQEEDNSKILCTQSFCEDFLDKNSCPVLPDNCKIQNATHNGLFLPYEGPCNCCQYCVENLEFGDDCVIGSSDGPLPTIICGDGLYCNQKTSKCDSNPSPCMEEQNSYEGRKKFGNLGHLQLKTQCDRRGLYQSLKCNPGETCFCVNKYGERIFGEIAYNMQASDITKCECARSVDMVNKVLGSSVYTSKTAKCLPDGNFNSIQCINKQCICVNEFDGSPIDISKKPYSIFLITEMPCYDPEKHANGSYFNPCEKEFNKIMDTIQFYKSSGFDEVLGFKLPNCQLDGMYASIQEQDDKKYCASPNGEQLENFSISKDHMLSSTMNCHCARTRNLISHFEKPSCCVNGNYECMQCRRGKCRCVDGNGVQVRKEVDYVDRAKLKCESYVKICKNGCTI